MSILTAWREVLLRAAMVVCLFPFAVECHASIPTAQHLPVRWVLAFKRLQV